jgi:ferric-dicitrate binding protein FerR (iron transport regulator)
MSGMRSRLGSVSDHDHDAARQREAQQTLDRLQRDGGAFLASALRRAAAHLSARDAVGPDGTADPIEVWGRRIGRTLSLLGVLALAIYLYMNYLR